MYKLTYSFPHDEIYGMTSQLRRAILSIPLNIIEGYARNSKKEFHRFLSIALGSLAESEYLLTFSYEQKYINAEEFTNVITKKNELGKLLWKLYISQGSK